MQCPKDRNETLTDVMLDGGLAAKCCPLCEGHWILPEVYEEWQRLQQIPDTVPILADTDVGYRPAPSDLRGGLCPDCGGFLARVRISVKPPFYVERCNRCGGLWCDRGEWDVLRQLGLHTILNHIFTADWQAKTREQEYVDRERRATVEKLGEELAQQIFDLAEKLENHPNGDFGVAYLMRRFEE